MLLPRNKLVNEKDLEIISITWGFTLGFGVWTTWTAMKQTRQMWTKRNGHLNHPYIWMIWGELLSCLLLSIVCWLVLQGLWTPNLASLFIILSLWVIQVHFLLQIIINRVSILMINRRQALKLRVGVAILICIVNVSVFCIWLPAKLCVSERYERINLVWDRIEKIIILLIDAGLNYYFIRTVQKSLIKPGLTKYRPLVCFNLYMILLSLTMDALIIGMLSLKNPLVYLMFHPLAYTVKLRIEMSMAELIAQIAGTQDRGSVQFNDQSDSSNPRSDCGTVITGKRLSSIVLSPIRTTQSKRDSAMTLAPNAEREDVELGHMRATPEPMSRAKMITEEAASHTSGFPETQHGFVVHRHDEVHMEVESLPSERTGKESSADGGLDSRGKTQDSEETPLQKEVNNNLGLETKVWGDHC